MSSSNSGSFSLDDSALRLRSDRHINTAVTVQYGSAFAILEDVIRLYRAHFWTLVAIYLLPVVPFTVVGGLITEEVALLGRTVTVLSLFAGVFAFAAIAVAMSDLCSGNRPGVRRSYRRIFGRRFGIVIANTALYYLVVLLVYLPAAVTAYLVCMSIPAFIVATLVSTRYMFVPVISAIEPRPGVMRAFRRSAWLGQGYLLRALGALLPIAGVGLVMGGAVYAASEALLTPQVVWIPVNLLVAPLVLPPLYIAVVLQYYDLRARKEGFRITELPEDIV